MKAHTSVLEENKILSNVGLGNNLQNLLPIAYLLN